MSVSLIRNLLYSYAEYIDAGDFEGAAALFEHAKVKSLGSTLTGSTIADFWRSVIRVYPCGTLRTKHVITNAIIEIEPSGSTAEVRSYYTVYQQTEELPLQVIAAGRYHDMFEFAEGVWRFSFRDYTMLDLVGDMSAHIKSPFLDGILAGRQAGR